MDKKGRAELLLEGLKNRVMDAPSATFNADKAVLDRKELLDLIDNISEMVHNELKEYRSVNDKKAKILKDAKAEAEEILYQAERSASRIRVTKRRADEPQPFRLTEMTDEERETLRAASDIYAASLIYTDEMLSEIDTLVNESYEKIEQEYSRMKSTLRQKIEDISENKTELMSNLGSLSVNDRYAQILELSELLSVELYKEREKALAKQREERDQMRLILSQDKESEIDHSSLRPSISPDRTAVKIEQKKADIEIKTMDRSEEAVGRKSDEKRPAGKKITTKEVLNDVPEDPQPTKGMEEIKE